MDLGAARVESTMLTTPPNSPDPGPIFQREDLTEMTLKFSDDEEEEEDKNIKAAETGIILLINPVTAVIFLK